MIALFLLTVLEGYARSSVTSFGTGVLLSISCCQVVWGECFLPQTYSITLGSEYVILISLSCLKKCYCVCANICIHFWLLIMSWCGMVTVHLSSLIDTAAFFFKMFIMRLFSKPFYEMKGKLKRTPRKKIYPNVVLMNRSYETNLFCIIRLSNLFVKI